MTKRIAVDLDDPAAAVAALRDVAAQTTGHIAKHELPAIADAIEAAADKRVIVLDVDELELPWHTDIADRIRNAAVTLNNPDAGSTYPTARKFLHAVADALDSLTPPRPPEPTGLGAVVRDKHGVILVRSGGRWHDGNSLFDWDALPAPIEVLSPGVDGGAS